MYRNPIFLSLLFSLSGFAQSTASLSGTVVDTQNSSVSGAMVTLGNPVTGWRNVTATSADGKFQFNNVPWDIYSVAVAGAGFDTAERRIALRSPVPVEIQLTLQLAGQSIAIDVAEDAKLLVDSQSSSTRHSLSSENFNRLPSQAGTRGLESVLLSFPGFAANANGAIHPRGAHNQMTYVIDGMPVTDQLTGAFANAIDPSIAQSVELYTGNVPAEFGSKVSGVASIITRSGISSGHRFRGSTALGWSEFDTLSQVTQASGGTERFGYFASVNTMKSNRFLDQVSLENLFNGGNSERGFTRFDWRQNPRSQLRLSLLSGRSSFQVSNLASQHLAGQRQRQSLEDFSASAGWIYSIDAKSTIDVLSSYRTSITRLLPSVGDTPVSASQARHLTTVNIDTRYSRQHGAHAIRAGAGIQRFPVSENFFFQVTSAKFNPTLPRGRLLFSERRTGALDSAFVEDRVQWKRFHFTLGLRYDNYRFLTSGTQLQPRVGLAYTLRETGTVFRASYNRNYQTPPNENLLFSSSPRSALREALGLPLLAIRAERQDVYEVGLQQPLAAKWSLNGSYYHKESRDMQDNDNFFNTGVIFPTSLAQARVNGAELRLVALPIAGFSGSLSATHYHAVVTPPFTGGLFLGSTLVADIGARPFVIDHDQTLGIHGVLNYSWRKRYWLAVSTRYDSGLVVNSSAPDDPDYRALVPYVNLTGDPARVKGRTISDVVVGYDRVKGDRKRWDVSAQITNITNKTALFNFQSAFVGTRIVAPRMVGAKLRWYF